MCVRVRVCHVYTDAPHQILACTLFLCVCFVNMRTQELLISKKKKIKNTDDKAGRVGFRAEIFIQKCRWAFSSHIVQSEMHSRCQLYYCNNN